MDLTVSKLDKDWGAVVRDGLDAVGEKPQAPDAYDVLSDDHFRFGAEDPGDFLGLGPA